MSKTKETKIKQTEKDNQKKSNKDNGYKFIYWD